MGILIPVLVLTALSVFYRAWAPLGGRIRGQRKARIAASPNARKRKFQNLIDTPMEIGFTGGMSLLWDQLHNRAVRRPAKPLTPDVFDAAAFIAGTQPRIVWLGHSTVLMRLGGKTILFDP